VTCVTFLSDSDHCRFSDVEVPFADMFPEAQKGPRMHTFEASSRLNLRNIVFLTDFSEPSSAALPFAIALARKYSATIHALHVLTPEPYFFPAPGLGTLAAEAHEDSSQEEMERVEAALFGVPHDTSIVREINVWPALEQTLKEHQADLIVTGTHGRTGAEKLLAGSVAEEVFRRSRVPVLTIGPQVRRQVHNAARFHAVMLATDFTPESLAATPYAVSLAQESEARLILLHVIRRVAGAEKPPEAELSVAHAMHLLHEMLPPESGRWCRPEAVVEYGDPVERILYTARDRDADLIVLGVRDAAGHLSAATHLERTTAHNIVARARCPVLTVRG